LKTDRRRRHTFAEKIVILFQWIGLQVCAHFMSSFCSNSGGQSTLFVCAKLFVESVQDYVRIFLPRNLGLIFLGFILNELIWSGADSFKCL
jgi:hypothetical protein